jgi:uncharacterized alkaline shock family protein YloU
MSITSRIILAVYMLLMIFISLCIVSMPFKLVPYYVILNIAYNLYHNWYYSLIGVIIFIVSLKLLLSGILSDRKTSKGIVKPAEFGDIKISKETFESLSLKVAKKISGIKDVKVSVYLGEGNVTVHARLLVMPDVNIPNVVSEVQKDIKSYIENITEIGVKEVKVTVDNIAQVNTLRVE